MCGRFVLAQEKDNLEKTFRVKLRGDYSLSRNISPTDKVWVIKSDSPESAITLKWGMTPAWWALKGRPLINIRAESLDQKPIFSDMSGQRCVILADGFYEWDKGTPKQPFIFRLKDGQPFAFPALWQKEGGSESCALVTLPANKLVGKIHDRMPGMILAQDVDVWLYQNFGKENSKRLLELFPEDDLTCEKIGPLGRA